MRQKPNYRKIVSGVDLPVPFTIRFFRFLPSCSDVIWRFFVRLLLHFAAITAFLPIRYARLFSTIKFMAQIP